MNNVYFIATDHLTELLSNELSNSEIVKERLTQLSSVFGGVALSTLTKDGFDDVMSTIDAQSAPVQSYLTNLLARMSMTLHLRLNMAGEGNAYTELSNGFTDAIDALIETGMFSTDITDRISSDDGQRTGAMILFLGTLAFQRVVNELMRGVNA